MLTWRRRWSISERALVSSARSAFSVFRRPYSSPSRVLPYTCKGTWRLYAQLRH